MDRPQNKVVNIAFYENEFFIVSLFRPREFTPASCKSYLAPRNQRPQPANNAPHPANNARIPLTMPRTPHIRKTRLNVMHLIEYNAALLIWKSKNGLAPTYISDMFVPVKSVHNHDTRNAEFGFQHPAKKNLTTGTKSFSHSG